MNEVKRNRKLGVVDQYGNCGPGQRTAEERSMSTRSTRSTVPQPAIRSADRRLLVLTLFAVSIIVAVCDLVLDPDRNICHILIPFLLSLRSYLAQSLLQTAPVLLPNGTQRHLGRNHIRRRSRNACVRNFGFSVFLVGRRGLDVTRPPDDKLFVCRRERGNSAYHCRMTISDRHFPSLIRRCRKRTFRWERVFLRDRNRSLDGRSGDISWLSGRSRRWTWKRVCCFHIRLGGERTSNREIMT